MGLVSEKRNQKFKLVSSKIEFSEIAKKIMLLRYIWVFPSVATFLATSEYQIVINCANPLSSFAASLFK
jgi:hypothetical protein